MSDLSDLKTLIESQGKAWEEFKTKNDQRLAAIEAKGYAPAELVGTVDTINGDLNKLSAEIAGVMKRMNRPKGTPSELTGDQAEHKSAVSAYLRTGADHGLHDLERKAMNLGSDPDGGYLADAEMDTAIDRIASTITAFRGIANVRTIGSPSYKKLVKTSGVSGGWIGEQETSSEGTTPGFAEIEIPVHKIYAEPWVTNDMLEDSMYDLENDLEMEAGITFGETEGNAFINGTGVKQPRGLATYTTVANASYIWGKIGFITSGASGAFAASNPGDKVIDLQHALKQQYRPGAVFLMADSTLAKVRQIKDGSGAFYLWNPDPGAGFGGLLLGSRVVVDDYMPVLAANSLSIAYGNFPRAYTIVDRRGIAIIRDNVTKKGTTKFHFSRRVGGGITNYEAVKLMKFAA